MRPRIPHILLARQAAVSPEDKFDPEEKLPFAFAETEAGSDDEEEDIPKYLRGRHIVDNELEDVIHMAPFDAIDLYTGQKNAGPLGQKYKQVGKFKGLVRLLKNKDEPPKFDQSEFLKPKDVFVRLYVLRGVKLMPKDDDGGSDPYLVVKLGKKKFSTRDNHLNNTLEPGAFASGLSFFFRALCDSEAHASDRRLLRLVRVPRQDSRRRRPSHRSMGLGRNR